MEYDYYKASSGDSSKTLVLIGGDGDTKESFSDIATAVVKSIPNLNVCTVSFEQAPNYQKALEASVDSLFELLDLLISGKGNTDFILFCTSAGAYCTCFAITNNKYDTYISKVLFFDPANYYLPGDNDVFYGTWDGSTEYKPLGSTVSDKLKEIKSNVIVDVVHFTVRTCRNHDYVYKDYLDRGKDVSGAYPRLSTPMVKSFFENLPTKNRGKYLEINNLPHGFTRDGNVPENYKRIISTLLDLLGNFDVYAQY